MIPCNSNSVTASAGRHKVYGALRAAFDVREVDEIDGIRLFEILDAAKQNEEEWMYQLQGNDAKTGKHAAFDSGWTAWREKKHAEAITIMEGFCGENKNEGDVVAQALLAIGMQSSDQGMTPLPGIVTPGGAIQEAPPNLGGSNPRRSPQQINHFQ